MSRLGLFEGFGVELEYMVVDAGSLQVFPVVDRILEAVAGGIVSEVEMGALAWSNELVLHVVELKTNGPSPALSGLDTSFQTDVLKINGILEAWGAVLLPTAMHPWMDPLRETVLWPHEFSPVYEAYDKIFGCQGHGWSNLQSTHINLPFDGDEEFGRLHASIRLLLPILPALAASSPLVEGKATGIRDNRMEFYRFNSRKVPSVAGQIIPEPVFARAAYEEVVLGSMYRDVAPFDPTGILQDEFLNSRGAIPRFGRGSIEIRVVDVQECPAADLALVAVTVGALKLLTEGRLSEPSFQKGRGVDPLARILVDCIRDGEDAVVGDSDFLKAIGFPGRKAEAREIWWHLLEAVIAAGELGQAGQEELLRRIVRRGTLSTEILRALEVPGRGTARQELSFPREPVEEVFRRLAGCLQRGEIFLV
jgi:gamma-glutamyl:cysteine ligase YbdK (ATP-grasp superfamily)